MSHTNRSLNVDSLRLNLKIFATIIFICVFLLQQSIALCFDLSQEMADCARVHRFPRLSDKLRGYNFGYGSLNDTDYMCRTKYHIRIIECVKERCDEKCGSVDKPHFLQVMWSYTLNTKRHERAADYICQPHNLRIFHQYKNNCLRDVEDEAAQCSSQTNASVTEVVAALTQQSMDPSGSVQQFQQKLTKIMLYYECRAMRKKFDCLFALLNTRCPSDAVQLIINYFIESLPDGCEYRFKESPIPLDPNLSLSKIPSVMQGDQQGSPLRYLGPRNTQNRHTPTSTSSNSKTYLTFACILQILQLMYNVVGSH